MKYIIQLTVFNSRIGALLQSNHFPTSDIEAGTDVSLFFPGSEQQPLGVIGIQVFGPSALLRSLAVFKAERGKGLGAALVHHAEQQAISVGVRSIYLLTTSAEKFFEARGYALINRNKAPASIAGTRQFSGLCPSSSAFMVKVLCA